MKYLEGLLGFAVLTGPMWLILLTLLIGIGIAVVVAKHLKQKSGKFVGIVGVFLILFLLLFGDEMAGKVYFNYLCATAAGVKVYQTVELPAKYWDDQGRAKFLKPNGDLDKTILGERFSEPHVIKRYSNPFKIDERRMQLVDRNNQKVLGEVIDFMYWGGWIRRNLSPNESADDCRQVYEPIFANHYYAKYFKLINPSK